MSSNYKTGNTLLFVMHCTRHLHSCIIRLYPKSAQSGTTTSVLRCPKCGAAKKSGKLSCCARGGAWFKNCGDVGDATVDHTWSEGVEVCKGFGASDSVQTPLQAMLRHVAVRFYSINTTQQRHDTSQRQRSANGPDSVFNGYKTDATDCVGLTKVVACIFGLTIIFSSRTYARSVRFRVIIGTG